MKTLSPKTRRLILGIALLATLLLTFWPETPSEQTAVSATSGAEQPVSDETLDLNKLRRERVDVKNDNAFASKTWYVAPPPPKIVAAPPPPPPKPQAPPMPFTYVGETRGPDGKLRYFLARGDKLFSVAPGEIIETVYRFDGRIGNALNLTYLPLNIKQSIYLRNAS